MLPAAAGVRGGRPALLLLSQLLFGEGPPARHPLFSSIPPPDPYGLEITVGWRAVWMHLLVWWCGCVAAAVGPRLRCAVLRKSPPPHPLHRPMQHLTRATNTPPAALRCAATWNPQGNRERYYEAANSMLDHVLGEREGIPISLAVLHAAVRCLGWLEG